MKANKTDTRLITTQYKYKYKLDTEKTSLRSLIENILLSDIYNDT